MGRVWVLRFDRVVIGKNEYENECIIIRKLLDSEKTVDLCEVREFFDVVLGFVGVILCVIEYEFLL